MQNPTYKIVELTNYEANRIVEYNENFLNWQMDIIDAINANKKPFIFYPYVNKNFKFPNMKDLLTVIEKATNKKGVAYNAQTDDDILKELKDVNSSWNKKDFVITNSKITVGVNYELSDFDLVFLSIAGFISPRYYSSKHEMQKPKRKLKAKIHLIHLKMMTSKWIIVRFIKI